MQKQQIIIQNLHLCENYNAKILKLEFDRLYNKIVLNDTNAEKDKFVRKLLSKTKSGVIWSGNK